MYKCKICYEVFPSIYDLKSHKISFGHEEKLVNKFYNAIPPPPPDISSLDDMVQLPLTDIKCSFCQESDEKNFVLLNNSCSLQTSDDGDDTFACSKCYKFLDKNKCCDHGIPPPPPIDY